MAWTNFRVNLCDNTVDVSCSEDGSISSWDDIPNEIEAWGRKMTKKEFHIELVKRVEQSMLGAKE
jgi:hypothetical protein